MSWILEHLQIIVFVAGAIAYWLNQRAREKAGEQADYDGDGIPEATTRPLVPSSRDGSDPEQDERVRRIQEEIRRKIAERQGRAPAPAAPAPGPTEFDPLRELLRPVLGEPQPEAPPPVPVVEIREAYDPDQAALERQRKLAEQLEELETRRAEARRTAESTRKNSAYDLPSTPKASAPGSVSADSGTVRDSLRSARSLRRAIVLREILDRPVALR